MRLLQYCTYSLIMLTAMALVAPLSVSAQENSTFQEQLEELQQTVDENQAEREQRQQERQEIIAERCDISTSRIDTTTQRYADGTLNYSNRYNNLVERLNNLANRLDEEEIDTVELRAYISQIENLTEQFNAEMAQTIATLEETKVLACGESEGAYLDLLQQSRVELLNARSTAVEINNIFLIDVTNELQELRDSL